MTQNDIFRRLTGVWRLMLLDAEASQNFELDSRGFIHSFMALILTLPILLFSTTSLWRMAQALEEGGEIAFAPFAALQIGGNLLYWGVYLVASFYIARFLNLSASFSAYVITYNWGTLFFSLIFAVPLFLYSLGLFNETGAIMLTLPALTALVWYRWQIAREVLGAPFGAAMAIIAFDFILGALVDQSLARLFF